MIAAVALEPVIDVEHRTFCGPRAISILTGVPISRIEKMILRKRGRDALGRRRLRVKGTYTGEVLRALRLLGCKLIDFKNPESTLGRFCTDTAHINATYLVWVTGHFCVVRYGMTSDYFNKPNRMVVQAWEVRAPAIPKFTDSEPPPKPRVKKPKPDIKQVRAARIDKRIKQWTMRLKRAQTMLNKLAKQRAYYRKTLATLENANAEIT